MSLLLEDEMKRLRRAPIGVDELGHVPVRGGVYIWWCRRRTIPDLPSHPHPDATDIDVLYVGVASGASAATSLRQKIEGDLHRSIERSRLRLDLALLLRTTLSLQLWKSKQGRPCLAPADDNKLVQWQREHLMFTWEATDEPRAVASAAIAWLFPPLNTPYKGRDVFWDAFLSSARNWGLVRLPEAEW